MFLACRVSSSAFLSAQGSSSCSRILCFAPGDIIRVCAEWGSKEGFLFCAGALVCENLVVGGRPVLVFLN